MIQDTPILYFDLDDNVVQVIERKRLPFSFRKKDIITIFDVVDFLSGRLLSLSRDNAKVILNTAVLPQSLKTTQRLKIVVFCRGLSMSDSYWIKRDDDNTSYDDVNLRKNHLSDAVVDVSLFGRHISIKRELLIPDIATTGMFRKCWLRRGDKTFLCKSDKTTGFINTKAEIEASNILDQMGANHVKYVEDKIGALTVALCENIADEDYSLVSADEIDSWYGNVADYARENFLIDFANMCAVDFILANTDRHSGNWGFMFSNANGDIVSMAPLYDHNQALVTDEFVTDIRDLIYEPTGMLFFESAMDAFPIAEINYDGFLGKCEELFELLRNGIYLMTIVKFIYRPARKSISCPRKNYK